MLGGESLIQMDLNSLPYGLMPLLYNIPSSDMNSALAPGKIALEEGYKMLYLVKYEPFLPKYATKSFKKAEIA